MQKSLSFNVYRLREQIYDCYVWLSIVFEERTNNKKISIDRQFDQISRKNPDFMQKKVSPNFQLLPPPYESFPVFSN